jgi:ligand-binding sensor domain-containing protein
VFYSPNQIFESGVNFDAQQILVPRNDGSGLADILLETEVVTAIAVDGANRKWIGTQRAGVFYLSEDGIEQLEHFTSSNSPLLSNSISGITINSEGEVFFGTANGIISYRSTSIPPPTPGSSVYAYPNPVRENYSGVIAIKNVPSDASVKITDTYGNIVYETKSEGAQAIWDGYNFDGRKAATGVYLVFVSNDEGTEKMVTKILVIR